MKHLRLTRPLVFVDLETTGTDPATDKIVEIAILRVDPHGTRRARTLRINPRRPIPAAASVVHGISDADVRDAPGFDEVAPALFELFENADLAGFNVRRFDLPLLEREFALCGIALGLEGRRVVDVMTIYHRKERRDLAAAVRFYLEREHAGAHAAAADIEATLEVLEAQLLRYPDLPRSVEELDRWSRARPGAVDESGKFVWKGGEVTFAFGKHQGKALGEVVRLAPDYLEWIVRADFPEDARLLVQRALRGDLPEKPPVSPDDQSA